MSTNSCLIHWLFASLKSSWYQSNCVLHTYCNHLKWMKKSLSIQRLILTIILGFFWPYLFSRSSLHLFLKPIIVTAACWKLAFHLFVCDTLIILYKPYDFKLLAARVLASIFVLSSYSHIIALCLLSRLLNTRFCLWILWCEN